MSFSEYSNKKKKEEEEEKKQTFSEWSNTKHGVTEESARERGQSNYVVEKKAYFASDDDIAPVGSSNWGSTYYDKWGKYTSETDYAMYSAQGAGIKNPSVKEAEGLANIFGWRLGAKEVGNIVTYSRDNYDQLFMGEMNTSNMVGSTLYHWMTDEEVGIYNYLLTKVGKDKAQEFLDDIEEELNRRSGIATAKGIKSMDDGVAKTLLTGSVAYGSGVESFGTGIKQRFSDEKLPTSATQVTSQELRKDLDFVGGGLYDAVNSIGYMTLPMFASEFVAPIAGVAGRALGLGEAGASTAAMLAGQATSSSIMGVASSGNAYAQALEEGYTKKQARLYGDLVGASEAGLQFALGGISSLGGKAIGKAIPKLANLSNKINMINNGLLRIAAKYGESLTKEITEEELQLFLEPAIRQIALGEEEYDAPTVEEMLQTAFSTALSTGFLETGNIAQGEKALSNADRQVVKEVAKQRIADKKAAGEKVTAKVETEIYDEVIDALEKGQLDIDTIESVLGGETYTAYKDNLTETAKLKQEYDKLSDIKESDLTRKQKKRLDELEAMNLDDTTKSDGLRQQLDNKLKPLLKNSKLTETYNERARRGQAFEADLTKYKGKQREAVERAINSGVLNNTYRSHELVNVLSKIEADKGVIFDYTNNAKLKESGFVIDGKTVNGFVKDGNVTLNVQSSKAWQSTVGHEITHVLEGTESYSALQSALFKYAESKGEYQSRYDSLAELYNGVKGYETDFDTKLKKELTADLVGDYLFTDQKFIQHLTGDRNLFQKVYDEIKYLCKIATGKELTEIEKVKREFDNAWKQMNVNAKTNVTNEAAVSTEGMTEADINKGGVEYDEASQSYSPTRYSLSTWNESDYVTERQSAAEDMSKALGVTVEKATDYIDSVNSIAKMIADDKVRLDYEASPGRSAFVGNAEYGGSIDFSTICKKRRLFTGTFEAIQNALPNTALTPKEILEIRKMMKDKGYEVSCGLCYVEGSRTKMGQYTEQFIERYKATNPEYVPNMAEMNTATGQERIRKEHPEVYEAYEYFMNHYGKLAPTDKAIFASQQKPKMYQMATEYKGEVLENFGNNDGSVAEKNKNGGLRLQSFSDFEIIHLIDSMQVIMDMSRVGLAGQAYTKVPDFAWALGDTGLKINLSVIAKGVDENGRLIFDEVEGMKESDAMALRDRYSDNVGTIIVTFTDEQLKAAMADERIDYIIPYHRSQWKADQYEMMGLPENTKDYTMLQSESYIEPVYNKNGKKQRPSNYMPNTYWDFNKSGKENAETYLRMCAENNRKPKFSHLLVDNHDGSYSLQPDGSTDGYWKTLIDFKMYNNDGIGVPQNPVAPNFNMEEAQRMLNEYTGGHAKFPIAQDIVDEFVSKHPDNIAPLTDSDIRFSLSESVEETNDLIAVHNLKANELLKTLELGGLPMPSIAIIKAEQEHEKYGDVSLIFPRQTIDPKASSANKVYGGDAWTPTYPRIEYKARESVSQKIKDKYYELADKIGYDAARPLYRYTYELDDALNSEGGEANLLNRIYDDTKMMQVYLEDSGKGKVEDIVKETRAEATEAEKEMNQWFIDKLGEDVVRSFKAPEGVSPLTHRKEFMAQHGEQVKQAYRDFFGEKFDFDEDALNNIVDSVKQIDLVTFMRKAESYLTNGGITIKTETDYDATDAAIREKAADGYQAWVDDLFKGVEEKTGIRNDKDAFTSRGDRRSWDALHWENTLENVVKAMKAQDQTGADAFSPASAIFAVAHKQYGSVEDIKADSDRLGRVSEEEYKAMEESYASRLAQIAKSIQDPSERNQFIASDEAASQIVDAVRNYKTKSGMLRYMQKWNSRVTESTVDDILSLVSDIANMPTGYFEAKPQRAVGLEEVGVFVIPNNADTKLKQELLNKGYSIAEYDPNVEGDRKRVVNQFEEYKFSLSNVGEEFTPTGNYSTPLSDTALEQDIAPVREGIAENATTTEGNTAPAEEAQMLENIPVLPDDQLADGTSEAIKPKREKQPSLKKIDSADNKIAQVLVEEPKVEQKKRSILSKAISNFIDKGAAVENLSLKTKNRALQDKYKAIGRSETKAQYFMEHGKGDVKSLDAIRTEIEATGKVKDFYNYVYHKHNIGRMSLESKELPNLQRLEGEMRGLKLLNLQENQLRAIASEKITKDTPQKRADLVKTVREYLASKDVKNKPVFGYEVTAEMSQGIANEYEAKNPQFKEIAQDVYDYMNYLRDMMVENGIISQETADLWAEMYPYFVPIRRDGHDGASIDVPLDTNKTGINAPIKRATGGNSDILPLLDTMALRTIQTFKAIDKNRFGVELKNTLGGVTESTQVNLDEAIDSIDTHEELLQEGKNGKNPTFTVFEGGERVTFEITDDLYDAMKPTSEALSYTNKVLNTASNLHRGVLTEYSVPFMVTNAIKDAQDVLINSQHPAETYANIPAAINELRKKGKWYTEYMENGGGDNTYFDKQTKTFTEEQSKLRKIVGFPLDKISKANNFIERIPRLAEYIASRQNGATVEGAMLDAARVTTDFSAGGDVTKFLNRNGATFLNASVQGFAQTVRNVREAKMNGLKGWLGLASKVALAGLPAMLLNGLLWDDDEEYEELSDYVKENYYIVGKYGDGKFVRIPKGRALAVIQNGFEQIGNTLTGDDEADFGRFFELFMSNLAPNNPLDNNIIAPIIQVVNNETWYGEDLVPTRLQDLPDAEQYDESTDAISKWLGEKTNKSPYKINYLLNQYGGGVSDIILPMLTPEAESGDDSLLGNAIAPLKDKFTTDSVMNNQNVSDFYETVDTLTTNAKSSYATDDDTLKSKYINSVNTELGELYKAKREIQNSNLSDSVKYAQVRNIQKQINELAENALNSYESVNVQGGYATVGDKHYRIDDGTWTKISDDQLDKQKKVTSGLGISPSEYWNNTEEYKFAYDYPDKYALSKSLGGYSAYKAYSKALNDITADKDSNGKSITGSRKEKVLQYINNLDADYETKILLYKSEYPSDDTYNAEIINYLNNRSDLTYDDRVAILTALGFRVVNGQIYAD